MTTRKRNEFLDIGTSDDEGSDRGYDSEAAETKGRASSRKEKDAGRAAKRRRISVDEVQDSASEDESDGEDGGVELRNNGQGKEKRGGEEDGDNNDDEREEREENEKENQEDVTTNCASPTPSDKSSKSTSSKKKKPLDTTKLPNKKNKTGVIYLSSLPPYLKPSALKSLLLQRGFGPITKVFLTPATPPPGASTLKKSNRRKTYTDGWVEFASKKTAKICAETLNATIVGGKKGGYYHDDVWNMKYLKGFKWADLMEQVQRERSEREAKRRIEDARARKEEKVFLQGVEKGKIIEGIQKKKQEKEKRKRGDSEEDGGAGESGGEQQKVEVRRVFKQNEVRTKEDRDAKALGEDTKRVLGKIF
ncbi:hypothetical protein VTN00DRAFT_4017 [Thermoascus crustaceus]|uniref:uncharacterized protein n=1 Tax=Thermoascus crustaceus TaxID=5088 RepID=UPI0037439F6B